MTAASARTPELERRRERRIPVHVPIVVRGIDSMGYSFEQRTTCENLCRGGAAFSLRHPLVLYDELEIDIPVLPTEASADTTFLTEGQIVHLMPGREVREFMVGVEFTGPPFDAMLDSEETSK